MDNKAASDSSEAFLAGKKPRVLLANDSADIRATISQLLAADYEVTAVSDGQDALDTALKDPPELIIADVTMPPLGGLELVRRLRAGSRTAAVPILLLSDGNGEESQAGNSGSGAGDYMVKPFTARELLVRVEAMLKLSRLRRESLQREEKLRAETRNLLSQINEGFLLLDPELCVISLNPEAASLLGMTEQELTGRPIFDSFPDLRGSEAEDHYRHALEHRTALSYEMFYPPWHRWFSTSLYPTPEGGLAVFFRDITERVRVDAILGGQKRALELAVHDAPLEQVLEVLTRTVEARAVGTVKAAIQLADEAGEHLFHGAAPSMPEGYIRAAQGLPIGPEHGSCGTAAYRREPVIVTDIANDPLWARCREAPLAHGLAACWSIPIISPEDKLLGTFAVYYTEVREPNQQDLEMVRLLCHTAALVIERERAMRFQDEARNSLQESEARFRNMSDQAPGMIWMSEKDGTCTFISRSWFEFTGQDPAIPPQDAWIAPVHPDDLAGVLKANSQAIAGERGFTMEYRLRHHDGSYRWVTVAASARRSPDGGFLGLIGSVFDITDRRMAEVELQRSEERFRIMADSIPQLAWTARPDGQILWYNKRWHEYTGTTPDEPTELSWESLVAESERPRVMEHFRQCLADGTPWEDTVPLRRRDGALRWHLSRMMPLRDEEGRVVMWFGTNTDITEQREADRRKDEFLATLAHELRNPLAPIRTGIEVLKCFGHDPSRAQSVIGIMERQTSQMVRLIDDLIDLSRISRGKLNLRREITPLEPVITQAVEAVQPLIEEHRHHFHLSLPPEPLHVDADPGRLAQVLSNLLNNAARYTPEGGEIQLALSRDGDDAVITVTDNGEGIAPEMQEHIFEMFAQGERRGGTANRGLGIGLTLVRLLVRMHDGEVSLHSDGPGHGSTFKVTLPLAKTRPQPEAPEDPGHGNAGSAQALRILVVDDGASAADMLALFFQLEGYEVRKAYDGMQALATLERFDADIVFLDIGMPGIDGCETARRIRGQPGGRERILVALTGWGQDSDRRKTEAAGFDHHLVKPVEPNVLRELLRTLRTGPATA